MTLPVNGNRKNDQKDDKLVEKLAYFEKKKYNDPWLILPKRKEKDESSRLFNSQMTLDFAYTIYLKLWIFDKAEEQLSKEEYDRIVFLGDLVDDWFLVYR